MIHFKIGKSKLLALLILFLQANSLIAAESPAEKAHFNFNHQAFTHPIKGIGDSLLDNYYIGRSFFNLPWVSAPASTKARDGLGPIFNANSCQSCHLRNGRGRLPKNKEPIHSALIRISIDKKNSSTMTPDPVYGDQIQPYSVNNKTGEAIPHLAYLQLQGKFADGETYELIKPVVSFSDWQYGIPDANLKTSLRVAPAITGMGLLETIPESVILAYSDPGDLNGDGISGKPNKVWDRQKQQYFLGRFGWKASQPNLRQQVASAFRNDIGITSTLFPAQPCSKQQKNCLEQANGGEPEINEKFLNNVVNYVTLIAPPKQRYNQDTLLQQGQVLFYNLQCNACHIPKLKTGTHAIKELSQQWIAPYTDLLLHDMGDQLADHRPDFDADGREWRTPPLWGIGLIEQVNNHQRLLHDGRARGLMEAILWHGGEAENAKQQVLQLSKLERQALLVFLKSL